jgi:hypothetical protein
MPKISQNSKKILLKRKNTTSNKDDAPVPVKDPLEVRKVLLDVTNYSTRKEGLQMACQKLNITFKAAEGKFRRFQINGGILNGNQMLLDIEETKLCALIVAFGAANRPLIRQDVINFFRKHYKKGE